MTEERIKVVVYKDPSTDLANIDKRNGQLIFTTDTRRLYLDLGSGNNDRKELVSYSVQKDTNDGHNLIFTNPDGSTITIRTEDTLYTGSDGVELDATGVNFVNTGVRSTTTGDTNGTIKVNTNGTVAEVTVKGIAAMAFKESVAASDITSGTIPVERGGIGVATLAAGEAVIGNGTSGVTTKAIDTTSGGTTSSSALITSGAVKSGLDTKLNTALKGAASGLAELDENGKVPSSQLPSYVDDVIEGYYKEADGKFYEESTYVTEIPGEAGKIYVDLSTEKSYRWSGSLFVFIGSPLSLGTTSSTAFRGDYGNIAYLHATDVNRLTTATAEGLYKIAATSEGHVASLSAVQASDIANAGVSITDTTYTLGADAPNNQITLTPSSGSVQNITVPYASNAGTVNNYTVGINVPNNAVFTDTIYEALSSSEITAITNINIDNYDGRSF